MKKREIFYWVYRHGFKKRLEPLDRPIRWNYTKAAILDALEEFAVGMLSLLGIFAALLFLCLSPILIPLVLVLAPIYEAWRCSFHPVDKAKLIENIEKMKRGEYR